MEESRIRKNRGKKKQASVKGQKKTCQERKKIIQTTRKRNCTEIQQLEKQAGCDCHANKEHIFFFSFLKSKINHLCQLHQP